MLGRIYVLLFPNGKRYVGQTIRTIEERMSEHWHPPEKDRSFPIHRAMRKYGKEKVKIEKALTLDCTQEYLDFIENEAIKAFGTLRPNGYNLKEGGSRGALCEEARAKIVAAWQGMSEEQKKERARKISVKQSLARANRSLEEDDVVNNKISLAMQSIWQNKTLEERQQKSRRQRETISQRTPEKRQEIGSTNSSNVARYHASLTPEERAARAKKISQSKINNTPHMRRCIIEGIEYVSIADAARCLGLPKSTIDKRVRSANPKFVAWRFL